MRVTAGIVLGGVLSCVGMGIVLTGLTRDKVQIPLGGVMFLIGLSLIYRNLKIKSLREKNFEWYRSTYPNAVDGKGQTKCFKCDSNRVHTKNLMNQTFTREHHCGNCGQTLYYSPEGR